MINDFQTAVLKGGLDGFHVVKRHKNPLRKYGLVHRDLGKIGAVEPDRIINLVSRLVSGGLPFKHPLILGLSESSILLGRVVCEYFGGGMFLFSTRYPHNESEMVSFTEPHSHAPAQFLKLSEAGDYREVCIVEDEITTGNTIMNLIQVLAGNLPSVTSVAVLALKALYSDQRYLEMVSVARAMGIKLSIRSLYRDFSGEDSVLRISNNSKTNKIRCIPCAGLTSWEYGRGRTDAFVPEKAALRYKKWEKLLSGLNLPRAVTVIGASEAIDLAFEIAQVLSLRGHQAFFRHLTISPWEVPGWCFPSSVPGTKPLHLYMPPHVGGTYILICDQPFQRLQVKKLSGFLQNTGAKTHILKGENYAVGDI